MQPSLRLDIMIVSENKTFLRPFSNSYEPKLGLEWIILHILCSVRVEIVLCAYKSILCVLKSHSRVL
jgi:hypothetical protein